MVSNSKNQNQLLTATAEGIYTLGSVTYGQDYDVIIATQATGQTCTVSGGTNTMDAVDTLVTITCTKRNIFFGTGCGGGPSVSVGAEILASKILKSMHALVSLLFFSAQLKLD